MSMITSTANPRIKMLLKLKEARERRSQGLCLIEGRDEIRLAIRAGVKIEEIVYAREGGASAADRALMDELRGGGADFGAEFIEVSQKVLARLAYREHPDSILAVALCPPASLADFEARLPRSGNGIVLILLEGVEKPGNIGAVLRSLDAARMDGLIACSCRTDLANPNIIRASKGSVFTLPVAECTSEEAHSWLLRRGYRIFALHPDGGEVYFEHKFYEPRMDAHPGADHRPQNMAFVFGAEHDGLSPFWLKHAHARLTIPMQGEVNSLNIAQAATLIAYEAMRQRGMNARHARD
jgi:TrmH family RNA methyltransferase